MPASRTLLTRSRTALVWTTPSAAVGSSRMIAFVAHIAARATATLCRCPPERSATGAAGSCRDTPNRTVRLGVSLHDPAAPVADLSGGQRQSVAVARAAMWATKAIILDEPTAALGVVQTNAVLD